ncbi:helix-turn-helix domain-containing protein [Bacillus sp. FJAT-29790]|uniref:helix-turn-helix domain-containing protein n=1 Tax=Bacillus sp. FJAT-29790 TaxID=1895002 RepID=UPI001C2229AC|nr:helix-turn-helix domain-containing protein [Bacillus sp. FJAT-29790]MBU8880102.1 helix-turn-helix domain-containing protein [Bacillus sp. FJAT-29790]
MREYNVHEVFAILRKYYITDCQQMVTRWIRDGKIHGTRSANRKDGYRVLEEDLFDFIEEERPGLPAIIETYEEYIKNLNIGEQKEKNNPPNGNNDEEKRGQKLDGVNEKVIDQLQQRIIYLENSLLELQEEKQIIEMDMIEEMELNNSRKEKCETLQEENKTIIELYEIIDEENKQLKEKLLLFENSKETDIDSKLKTENANNKPNHPVTFEDYKNISNDTILKLDPSIKNSVTEDHLRTIYDQIFHEGFLRQEFVADDGKVRCPFTQKMYKQQKRLINNATKQYFESLSAQNKNEVEPVNKNGDFSK